MSGSFNDPTGTFADKSNCFTPVTDRDELVERLERVMGRAEPLPWCWEQCGEKEDVPVVGVAFDRNDVPQVGKIVSDNDAIIRFNIASDWGGGIDGSAPSANALFVVEAVNAIPALIDRIQSDAAIIERMMPKTLAGAFCVAVSESGKFRLELIFPTLEALHRAHDEWLAIAKEASL